MSWILSEDPHKRLQKVKASPGPKLFYATDPAKIDRMRDEYDVTGVPPLPMVRTPPSRELKMSSDDETIIVFRGEIPTVLKGLGCHLKG